MKLLANPNLYLHHKTTPNRSSCDWGLHTYYLFPAGLSIRYGQALYKIGQLIVEFECLTLRALHSDDCAVVALTRGHDVPFGGLELHAGGVVLMLVGERVARRYDVYKSVIRKPRCVYLVVGEQVLRVCAEKSG